MTDNRGRIQRQRRGQPIRARTLQALADTANDGKAARPARQTETRTKGALLKAFTVVSEAGDYLVCLPLNVGAADRAANYVAVAKPPLLRRTPYDGATRNGISYTYTGANTRTADDGSSTEDQIITDDYVAGDEIHAYQVLGGTGVTDADGYRVIWADNNADGRFWAKSAS